METVKFPDPSDLLIGYSGGKDSLAVLDLAVRAGKRVECFFMYFLPGLDYTAHWCEFARARWGVPVRQYQHWNICYYLRRGVFRSQRLDVPPIRITDIERQARADSGIEWIAYGYKSIDSLQRRGMLNSWVEGINPTCKACAPLKAWNNTEVKSYLSRRNIPIPGIDGKRSTGVSLTPRSLAWLRVEWPSDYRRILKVFPHAEAQADRAGLCEKDQAPAVRVPRDPPLDDPGRSL